MATVAEIERRIDRLDDKLSDAAGASMNLALDIREQLRVAVAEIQARLAQHSDQHQDTIHILRGKGGANGAGGIIADLRELAHDMEVIEAAIADMRSGVAAERRSVAASSYQRWRVVLLILALLGAYVLPVLTRQPPNQEILRELLRDALPRPAEEAAPGGNSR